MSGVGPFLPPGGKKGASARLRLAAAALAALALLAAGAAPAGAPAAAAQPRATLVDIEDEVMCPVCGTLLQLAEAPQAKRQRAFVSDLIAAGRDKEQIKEALVAEYGSEVLALPEGSGFALSAYLVPVVAFAAAALGLALGVRRWRRAGGGDPPGGPGPPGGEEAVRLEADLARYDL